VDLHTVEWCFTGHYCKNFQVDKSIITQPSASVNAALAEPKAFSFKVYKAKDFANDFTVFSSKFDSNLQAPTSLLLKAANICFVFHLPNFIWVVFTTEFSMPNGNAM